MRPSSLLSCIAVWLIWAVPAQAWNSHGHRVIALSAYRTLTDAQKNSAHQILTKHPHFSTLLSQGRPTSVDTREWAFLQAAVWPDLVRPPPDFHGNPRTHDVYKFHRGVWHYVNYPYTMGRHPALLPPALPESTTVAEQVPKCIALVKSGGADSDLVAGTTAEQNRAVRLCWLLHLLGDMHQPLHTAALVDEVRFPASNHGDQGGNLLAVQTAPGRKPIKLHVYWDGLLGTDESYAEIAATAQSLANDPSLAKSKLGELVAHPTPADWLLESYMAAVSFAYLNGDLQPVKFDDGLAPGTAPVLDATVQARDRTAARRRGMLAAHRLSAVLQQCLP